MLNGLSVSEGNMPQKKNEILVEKDYLSKQGIDAKIGDKIVLPGENNQERQEFVISGYIKTSAKGTDRSLYAAIVSMEYFLDIDGWNTLSPMAMFRLKSQYASESEQIQNEITKICKEVYFAVTIYQSCLFGTKPAICFIGDSRNCRISHCYYGRNFGYLLHILYLYYQFYS